MCFCYYKIKYKLIYAKHQPHRSSRFYVVDRKTHIDRFMYSILLLRMNLNLKSCFYYYFTIYLLSIFRREQPNALF